MGCEAVGGYDAKTCTRHDHDAALARRFVVTGGILKDRKFARHIEIVGARAQARLDKRAGGLRERTCRVDEHVDIFESLIKPLCLVESDGTPRDAELGRER